MDVIEYLRALIEKALTVIIDRRAWAVGIVLALGAVLVFADPDAAPLIDQLGADVDTVLGSLIVVIDAVDQLLIDLGALAATAIAIVNLVKSWAARPPSGLNFREVATGSVPPAIAQPGPAAPPRDEVG